MKAFGGSHKIAAMVGDLYSPNFKGNLEQWLNSVPYYPRPFDWNFVPITEVLQKFTKTFLDEECVEQCAQQSIQATVSRVLALYLLGEKMNPRGRLLIAKGL